MQWRKLVTFETGPKATGGRHHAVSGMGPRTNRVESRANWVPELFGLIGQVYTMVVPYPMPFPWALVGDKSSVPVPGALNYFTFHAGFWERKETKR